MTKNRNCPLGKSPLYSVPDWEEGAWKIWQMCYVYREEELSQTLCINIAYEMVNICPNKF